MRNFILLTLLGIACLGKAQNNFFIPDSTGSQLLLNSYGGVASTSIQQSFMNKFLFPGFIDNDLKTRTSEKLKDENRFGGELTGSVNIYFPKGSLGGNNFYGFGVGTTMEGNLNFTDDLFNGIFFGNKAYAGEVLNLNNTSFNSISYSYIEFSFGATLISKKATQSYWVDAGLVFGHQYSSIQLPNASLFTEENGDYLDITIQDGTMAFSNSASTDLIQGIGGKLNLNYSYVTDDSKLLIQAKNIGVISFSDVTSADIDTTLRFEGVEIDNIFNLSDSVMNRLTSLDSLVDTKNGNQTAIMPIDINMYYAKDLGKMKFDVVARHKLFANYFPYLRGGFYYKLPIVTPGVTVAYGGYGSIQAGLNAELNFIKTLRIILGTNNLLGAVAPNTISGMDAFLGMKYNF